MLTSCVEVSGVMVVVAGVMVGVGESERGLPPGGRMHVCGMFGVMKEDPRSCAGSSIYPVAEKKGCINMTYLYVQSQRKVKKEEEENNTSGKSKSSRRHVSPLNLACMTEGNESNYDDGQL